MALVFVKKAVAFDAPKIYNLICKAYAPINKELNLGHPVAALKENSVDILRDMDAKNLLVATQNGNVIGTVRYEVLTDANGVKVAYISRLCVGLDQQRAGVGSKLVAEVEAQCKAQGVDTLVLHTPTIKSGLVMFYYKNGFYIHSTNHDNGYVRGMFVKQLTKKTPDYSCLGDR